MDVLASQATPFGHLNRIRLYLVYLWISFALARVRHKYDGIVFTDANQGVVFAAVSRLLHLNVPRIVLFDLIAYRGGHFRTIVNWLLIYAAKRISAVSVASEALADIYRKMFPEIRSVQCVPGAFGSSVPKEGPVDEDGTIFSGGASLRDWPTLMRIARRFPGERFVICARRDDRFAWKEEPLSNVQIFFDLDGEAFHDLMDRAKIVILPLFDVDTTAGLSVLASALRRGKPTIITRTIATETYIEDGCNGLLVPPGNVELLSVQLRRLLSDDGLRSRLRHGAREWSEGPVQTSFFAQFNKMLDAVLLQDRRQ